MNPLFGVVFGRLCTSTDLDTSLFFGPRSAIHVYSALCFLFCGSDERTMHSSARNTESGNLKTPPRPLFTSKCFQPLPTLAEPISMHCIVVPHFVCASMHITALQGAASLDQSLNSLSYPTSAPGVFLFFAGSACSPDTPLKSLSLMRL